MRKCRTNLSFMSRLSFFTCREASITRKIQKILFAWSQQRKKPITGSSFRKAGCCVSDAIFSRKTRLQGKFDNSNPEMIGPWVISAILDVTSTFCALGCWGREKLSILIQVCILNCVEICFAIFKGFYFWCLECVFPKYLDQRLDSFLLD